VVAIVTTHSQEKYIDTTSDNVPNFRPTANSL
jgi:hypothetical protein